MQSSFSLVVCTYVCMYVCCTAIIQGKLICKEAFRTCLGISLKTLRSIYRHYSENLQTISPPEKKKKRLSDKSRNTIAWMKNTIERIGEKMSHLNPVRIDKVIAHDICTDNRGTHILLEQVGILGALKGSLTAFVLTIIT